MDPTVEGRYSVASLWIGPALSWMEQICLMSFLENGHETILYCYDDVANVPLGVQVRDANDLMPCEEILVHQRTGSPAFHSDIFRLRLLSQTPYLWIDTDAYCLRPIMKPKHGYYFGRGAKDKVYSGVLDLPASSRTLTSMLEFCSDAHPIPPWLPRRKKRELIERQRAGRPVHVSQQQWGVLGPEALTYFLNLTEEQEYALEPEVLYPVPFSMTRAFYHPWLRDSVERRLSANTVSIHFYGRRFRNLFSRNGGIPPEGSFAEGLCIKHGVDPRRTAELFQRRVGEVKDAPD